jgi:hypothetical protein
MSPNLVWVNLAGLDFSEGAIVRRLDLVKNPDQIGACTMQLELTEPFGLGLPDLK